MNLPNNHQYTTSDTSLATYLICKGFVLDEIDYTNPRYEFKFSNGNTKIQEYAQKYITGKALVDPATFTRINRKITRLLKNQMQWWGE